MSLTFSFSLSFLLLFFFFPSFVRLIAGSQFVDPVTGERFYSPEIDRPASGSPVSEIQPLPELCICSSARFTDIVVVRLLISDDLTCHTAHTGPFAPAALVSESRPVDEGFVVTYCGPFALIVAEFNRQGHRLEYRGSYCFLQFTDSLGRLIGQRGRNVATLRRIPGLFVFVGGARFGDSRERPVLLRGPALAVRYVMLTYLINNTPCREWYGHERSVIPGK